MEPYAVLGVTVDATDDQIRRAFRRIALDCHPDVAGDDPEKADRFRRARDAYELLGDPDRRAEHDRAHTATRRRRAERDPEAPPEEVFRDFGFGDDLPRARARVRGTPGGAPPADEPPRRRRPPPEPEAIQRIDVPFTDALLGGVVEVDTPGGRVRLRIAPGTSSGAVLRVREKGAPDADGSRADHRVEVRIVVPATLDPEAVELVRRLAARLGRGSA